MNYYKVPVNENNSQVSSTIGHYGGSVEKYALDNKTSTHWEGGRSIYGTNANFTVKFNSTIEFQRVLYYDRRDTEKGWPLKFELYGIKEGKDTEELLYTGTMSSRPSKPVQCYLASNVTLKEFKFRFISVKGDWVSMSILAFLKEDSVLRKGDNIFTDGTWSDLTEDFNTEDKIKKFEEEANKHPLGNLFTNEIRVARDVIKNGDAIRKSIFTHTCVDGGTLHNIKRTGQWFYKPKATGRIIFQGEEIEVFCENYNNTEYPNILFSKTFDRNNEDFQTIILPTGRSVVNQTQDFQMTQYAEIMWICTRPASSIFVPPKCRYTGGHEIPHYELGDDIDTFTNFLKKYQETAIDYSTNTTFMPNVAEFESPNVIISADAKKAYESIVEEKEKYGNTIEDAMKYWETFPVEYAKYSGFTNDDPNPVHHVMNVTFLNRLNKQSGKPYAWSDWAFTYYDMDFAKGIVSKNSLSKDGWGYYHEWGHSYDCSTLIIGETTNNLFSLMMERRSGTKDRLSREDRWGSIEKTLNLEREGLDSVFDTLGAIRQLEIYFGEGIVAKIHRLAREGFFDSSQNNITNIYDKWMVGLSNITGYNCADHFKPFGWECSEKCENMTKDLKKLPIKTWHITERVYTYKGNGLPSDVKPKIVAIANINGSLNLQLSLSSDPENEFEDLLGYDIEDENGNQVGWTYTSSWTSAHKDFYNGARYYIYAVDLKMQRSSPLAFNWDRIDSVDPVVGNYSASLWPSFIQICTRYTEPNTALEHLLDGDNKTCMFTENTATQTDVGFILDLNGSATFQGFYYQSTRTNYGRTKHYRISISNDNETWQTIASSNNLTMPNVLSNERKEIFFSKEYTASYFRFEQIDEYMNTRHLSVCDFGLLKLDTIPLSSDSKSGSNSKAVAIAVPIVVVIVVVAIAIVILILYKKSKEAPVEGQV
jgi:hypothetical protein